MLIIKNYKKLFEMPNLFNNKLNKNYLFFKLPFSKINPQEL
jgi:hypothetical protein